MPPTAKTHRMRTVLSAATVAVVMAGAAAGSSPAAAQSSPNQAAAPSAQGAAAAEGEADAAPLLNDDGTGNPAASNADIDGDRALDPFNRNAAAAGTSDGLRPVVRDGDLSWPSEPQAPVDGVVQQQEPETARDGIDPLAYDTRPPEDIAVFEQPAAGHDPLHFQIEDLQPLEDRRTRRLYRFEPYDPVGVRIGSFVLFPEAELGSSWYSNVLRSPSAQSDAALDFKPSGRLVSDWHRHALEFRAASTLSFFSDQDSENDRAYQLEARGRVDVTRRTNLQAFVARDYSQESRSAIDANRAGDRASLTNDRVGMTFNHRFNRLSLQLRGTFGDYTYSDVSVGGVVQSNADRNYTSLDGAVRASWEFKPTLTGFVEVGANQRDYSVLAQSDGISRDSKGERYRAGVSFGNTGQILRGEIALGYGTQTPDDTRLRQIDGILLDANLAWRMSELTTLAFNARSDIAETTTVDSGGVFTRSLGVEARHAFRRHLIGTAGLTYSKRDYEGVPIEESEWNADLGAEYFLSREAILFGRYRHTIFETSAPAGDYTSDEFHVGMRVRR